MEGYIKLYRKIKENKYWLEPRKFSQLEAWIDMLLKASFKDKALVIGDIVLSLKAGQFVTSQVKLSEAWGWNREEKPAIKPTAKPTTAQHQASIKTGTINNDKNENNEKKIHIFIMKTQFLELSQRYKDDQVLIKGHLLKEGYREFQIEEAFQKYAS